tara:strand:- start:629 stop:1057 length:429 start_codon:yes stop_codon:yes gene_type:complete
LSKIPPLHVAYLCIGSNVGNCNLHLKNAIKEIKKWPRTEVVKISKILETEPYGPIKNQDNFFNQMIKIKSFLNPLSVIDLIEVTENKLGRDRKNALKKGPRIIDIDLIIFDSLKIASKRLTLPHPSLGSRAYVLKLMEDIDG